jgi:hypothetical protein
VYCTTTKTKTDTASEQRKMRAARDLSKRKDNIIPTSHIPLSERL